MNKTQAALLKMLADGQVCSGELLGKTLSISRAAVWKHIQQLQSVGLVLERVRGSGYRLEKPLRLLDQTYISDHINKSSEIRVMVESSVESTNQCLYEAFNSGERRPSVMFAEYQSQGRGRRGREWRSPFGSNLYFSVAWPYSQGVNALEGVSLAMGLGICRALNRLGIARASLKWPNDVLYNGKKLAGILVEIGGDVSGDCFIVVGVGLNVNMPRGVDIDQAWIDLSTITQGETWDRNLVAVNVLNELVPMLRDYAEQGFAHYQQAWQSFHAYQNKQVRVFAGNREIEGECLGVDHTGSLRLAVNGKECVFSGGELSLRAN